MTETTEATSTKKQAKPTKRKKKWAGVMPDGPKITKEYSFDLTQDELAEKGQEAAKHAGNVINLDLQFEEVKKDWKARITTQEAKRDELLAVLRARKEVRKVEVVMEKDFEAKMVRFWFEGSVIEKRTMTQDELQAEMDFQKRKADGDKAVTGKGMGERAKAVRQKIEKTPNGQVDPVAAAHAATGTNGKANGKFEDIAQVHQMETKRATKTSAVDGPVKN